MVLSIIAVMASSTKEKSESTFIVIENWVVDTTESVVLIEMTPLGMN